jgi:hypothetical protein
MYKGGEEEERVKVENYRSFDTTRIRTGTAASRREHVEDW